MEKHYEAILDYAIKRIKEKIVQVTKELLNDWVYFFDMDNFLSQFKVTKKQKYWQSGDNILSLEFYRYIERVIESKDYFHITNYSSNGTTYSAIGLSFGNGQGVLSFEKNNSANDFRELFYKAASEREKEEIIKSLVFKNNRTVESVVNEVRFPTDFIEYLKSEIGWCDTFNRIKPR